ncbi:hypothetical protein CCR75_006466 [Bremia lactucae]|uniref:Uncharacterized protein n=1 Tax=Bremia lactucae TaxID=4779 RepID=A0A976IH98_BRELC|nr:hypothetical protein CCR75_006466 [Bremia lactucae]
MASLGVLFIIAILVLVGSVTTNQASVSKLPAFFFHGATGNKTNGAEIQANLAAQSRICVALDFANQLAQSPPPSLTRCKWLLSKFAALSCRMLPRMPMLITLAHSQGASIARGVIMEMDEASDATPLQVLQQALGPFAVNKADLDFF